VSKFRLAFNRLFKFAALKFFIDYFVMAIVILFWSYLGEWICKDFT